MTPSGEAPRRPEAAPRPSADDEMARILADPRRSLAKRRAELTRSGDSELSGDLARRMNALEFVDSLVGGTTDLPERLGDYRITGLLGRGGMGTVYEAWQESLEREVAIKVLSPVYSADPTMRKRFRSEARSTAALHHQHIVPIYDYGEAAGYLYFVMEKVDGVSLDKKIRSARRQERLPLEPLDAARRFAGVADALGHAHKRRLLHRDVKPGNILVAGDGTLALADFGLSKMLGEHSARLTSQGGFLGTLHYAAPEQAMGRELTEASDLYSLGVTLFEALTGELPTTGTSTEALLNAKLYGRPARLREVAPHIPRDLDLVVDKLLAREPEDRYTDGGALARDLQRVSDGEPVHIRRQPPWSRAWRWARRNPGLTAATVAAAVLLLITAFLARGMAAARDENARARHEILIGDALEQVAADPGVAYGRHDVIAALTGVRRPGDAPPAAAAALLEEAAGERPDDPRPRRLLRALRRDPLPVATLLLREGKGHEAVGLLDGEIAVALQRRQSDPAAELELYELYLARAIGRMTASVGDLENARLDLSLAGFLRDGAFLPRVLGEVIALGQGEPVDEVLPRLERLVATGPGAAAEDVVGQLLMCASGLLRPPGANLVPFDLVHPDRLELLRAARELWDPGSEELVAAGGPTGLELELAQLARQGVGHARAGDSGDLAILVQAGRAVLQQSVAPDAPLRKWGQVFRALELLLDPEAGERAAAPLPVPLQVAGWTVLLELEPGVELVRLMAPHIRELAERAARDPGMCRLQAELGLRLGPDPEALERAAAWVAAAPRDPRAYRCRFRMHLLLGRPGPAMDDALRSIECAADRRAATAEVCRRLEEAQARFADRPGLRAELGELAASFGEWLR